MIRPQIVSWHPVLTAHQSHTLKALKEAWGNTVEVVVAATEHEDRRRQGWTAPDTTGLAIISLPGRGRWRAVRHILESRRDAIHLFGSPFENSLFMLALLWAQLKGIEQVHLISEPYSTEAAGYLSDNGTSLSKIKAKFRPLIYKLYSLLLLRKISGVFAISRLASLQYQSLGVKESQIAPFGYFVPQIDGAMSHQPVQPPNRPLKVIFVGSLIAIKGLDGLLESVDRVYASGRSIRLDVFGPGDPNLFTWNSQHSIYRGVIPFGLAQTVIRDYDVLVLPSRYDGWGVVVNEAIQSGTPVLCSNRVGAGSVLEKFGCGRVFQLDDSNVELVNILIQLIEQSTLLSSFRQATGEAASKLAPAVAGTYMSEVLEATLNRRSKPACPWY